MMFTVVCICVAALLYISPASVGSASLEGETSEHEKRFLDGNINRLAMHHFIREAEFVFLGTVQRVSYRMPDVLEKDHVALPHTFVTYKIEEVLKGISGDDKPQRMVSQRHF